MTSFELASFAGKNSQQFTVVQDILLPNVGKERLDARSKICKKNHYILWRNRWGVIFK